MRRRISPEELESLRRESLFPIDFEPASSASTLRLLASLDRDLRAELMTEQQYEAGEIICHEGEPGDAMYLIWTGRVIVVKGGFPSPTVLGYRGPGEIIGEMALLENRPRSASNIAIDPVRVLRISREDFHAWLSTNPSIGINIMSTLSARLRTADIARIATAQQGRRLVQEVQDLKTEKQQLLELQRVRQETSDLIVHDLRNPLGVLAGAISMLEMVLPEDVLQTNHELVDLANAACGRMQRLVDSLLDVAKLETGEFQVTLMEVNPRDIMQETLGRQTIVTKTRGINLQLDVPDDLPFVQADPNILERVLTNLLDNAIKYTPKNGTIILRGRDKHEHLIISVTDSGPGIPPTERERIFERFAQVDNHHSKRRGFGLGLTFCRLAIEAHGGQIWVEDGPDDVGSQFAFTLPF